MPTSEIDFFLCTPAHHPAPSCLKGTAIGMGHDGMHIVVYLDDDGEESLVYPSSTSASDILSDLASRMAERARSARNSAKASTASTS